MQSARGSTKPQDAWDDESFALTPLSIEEEEDKFVAPKHQLTGDDAVEYAYADEDRPPALLVDLTAILTARSICPVQVWISPAEYRCRHVLAHICACACACQYISCQCIWH